MPRRPGRPAQGKWSRADEVAMVDKAAGLAQRGYRAPPPCDEDELKKQAALGRELMKELDRGL